MRKSLDTRIIDNLNKRRPVYQPERIDHTLTENDIDRLVHSSTYADTGKKGYKLYVKKFYTGVNDIGPYLEEHLNLDEVKSINIIVDNLPNFYFGIRAINEIGDDLFVDYDINVTFNYTSQRELPAQITFSIGGFSGGNWYIDENPNFFMNFNGVWITSKTIWEAE